MELVLIPLFALISLLCFVLYVIALVNAARAEKWVWFVLMLLIGPLALFYLLFAYERRLPPPGARYRGRY